MDIRFAPMEGVTDTVFRQIHHKCFGGVSRYYIPFVSPTQNHFFTARELKAISPESNAGMNAVPQLLAKDPEHFLWAAGELHAMGYEEVNLNIGCPSGTVTAKGKGAGMLRDPDGLQRFLEAVFEHTPIAISVKTRIGFESPDEWPAILRVLSAFPLRELIIHPRTRTGFYKGPLYRECFEQAAAMGLPVVYNGDLFTRADCDELRERHPEVPMMLGRGLIANPALARELNGGEPVNAKDLQYFHDELQRAYLAQYPKAQVHSRMREVMKYISCCFQDADKALKAIRKSTPETYPTAVERLLACPLREDPGYRMTTWLGE